MKPMLAALRGERVDPPPIWLMRQAGRYLPEYREVRAGAGSFLDLCYNPELACEVTLQPIRRFGFDAAILFSDILVVPHALGRPLTFVENEGPKLTPLPDAPDAELDAMAAAEIHDHLAPVYATLGKVKAALPAEVALIGFAGAPWTLACYIVDGQGSKEYLKTRLMAAREPERFARLIGILEQALIAYLCRQIEAGAEVVKLFDSWAGVLAPDGFRRWSLEPLARITAAVKARHPDVPVVVFPRGAGLHYPLCAAEIGADGLALDTAVPTDWAARTLPPRPTPSGNLDPVALVAGGATLDAAVDRIRADFAGRPHVFNLGHGVVPQTDPAHVARLVARVRNACR
jgi:uroporphyrinogen decarboxylase